MTEVLLEMIVESAHRHREDSTQLVQMPTISTLRA